MGSGVQGPADTEDAVCRSPGPPGHPYRCLWNLVAVGRGLALEGQRGASDRRALPSPHRGRQAGVWTGRREEGQLDVPPSAKLTMRPCSLPTSTSGCPVRSALERTASDNLADSAWAERGPGRRMRKPTAGLAARLRGCPQPREGGPQAASDPRAAMRTHHPPARMSWSLATYQRLCRHLHCDQPSHWLARSPRV